MGQAKEKAQSKAESGQARRVAGQKPRDDSPVASWRQVEALRERQALKKELSDIWSEDPELDDSIFFSDKESKAFYQRATKLKNEDFEINEDDDPDDED